MTLPGTLGAHEDVQSGKIKLGRAPAKSDPRTPSILKMLTLAAPKVTVPSSKIRTTKFHGDWLMLNNDKFGDCEFAEWAHALMLLSAVEGKPWSTTGQDVSDAYFKYTGGQDSGSNMLECANLRLKNKWANFGAPVADAYVGIDLGARMMSAVKASIYVLGNAALGVGLPLALQKTPYDWTHVPSASERSRPEWQPGGWGGHAVTALDYDHNNVYIISWGKRVPVSWGMLAFILDEAYGYMHPFWRNRKGNSPTGLSAAQVLSYINSGAI